MQNYSYTAKDDYGKTVKGTMMAENELELSNKIRQLGYFIVQSQLISDKVRVGVKILKMSAKDTLSFTIHLSTLVDAGVPLLNALRDLARDAQNEDAQKIIDDIRYRVESGSSLKDALTFYPHIFSPLYISIVGAGESTGRLSDCLHDLSAVLEWQIEMRKQMVEMSTYPAILFFVMVSVVTLLVVKVIPTFEPIFKELHTALPLPTQIVLGVSKFIRGYWYLIIIFFAAAVISCKFIYKTSTGKYRIDSLKLKIPVMGELIRKIALSQFCHTFALALKAGVPVLSSLDIAANVVGNYRIYRSIIVARDAVNVGEKLASAFQVSGEFPPLVIRMIGVGEQSGALPDTLGKVNQFYDREVPSAIKRLFTLFEPMMIIFMGVVVGGIALALFMPIFQMAQLMSK